MVTVLGGGGPTGGCQAEGMGVALWRLALGALKPWSTVGVSKREIAGRLGMAGVLKDGFLASAFRACQRRAKKRSLLCILTVFTRHEGELTTGGLRE